MAVYEAPDSYEQFVAQYDYFIAAAIRKITKGMVRDDEAEDLKQAVFLRVIQTDYLSKYNREKGSFSNYLYFLVRSVLCNIFAQNTRNPLNMAIGVRERIPNDGEQGEHCRLVLEAHRELTDQAFERSQVNKDLLEKLDELTVSDGTELRETLRLLYEGYSVAEIRRALQTTTKAVEANRVKLQSLLGELMMEASA